MFGTIDPDRALQQAIDGSAWDEFCDLLKMAGNVLRRPEIPNDPLTRAEGLRYLSRITRAALEAFVEHNDPRFPVLQRVVHETVKMGADNPDNYYQNCAISGAYEYRIKGVRGSVQWLEFATQKGSYGQGRGMPPTGHLDARDMQIDEDGSFVVQLSCERKEGNWLPMEPESGTLIVRQSRLDPFAEELADIYIERVGDEQGSPTLLQPATVVGGLRQASMLVGGAATIFAGWAEGFMQHVNELPRFDPAISNSMGGVPDIAYYHSYWRLAEDECLVIEAEPPPCDHWNFQLNNHWMESLDYRYHQIHTNSALAATEADGSIRLVVAHTDPGHMNWIRTVGHGQGTMCFRWVRPEVDPPPQPSCRVLKLAALVGELRGAAGQAQTARMDPTKQRKDEEE